MFLFSFFNWNELIVFLLSFVNIFVIECDYNLFNTVIWVRSLLVGVTRLISTYDMWDTLFTKNL